MDVYKLLPWFLSFLGHPAFSGSSIVVGFVLLWRYGSNPAIGSNALIVNPYTKLPFEQSGYPIFRRAGWTSVVALVLALFVWISYRSGVKDFIYIEPLPSIALNGPTVPDIRYRQEPIDNAKQAAKSAPFQGTKTPDTIPSPAQPITSSPQPTALGYQPPQAPTADQPATCPPAGTLTSDWNINVNSVMSPGGYNFTYNFNNFVMQSLHPYLKQLVRPGYKPLDEDRLIKAINLTKEVRKMLPKPAPARINGSSLTPEVALQSVKRSLSNNFIQAIYATKLSNGTVMDNPNATYNIPIAGLPMDTKEAISDFDQLAKSDGDSACKEALAQLTKQQ